MTTVNWISDEPLEVFDATRPLAEILENAETGRLVWIVLKHTEKPNFYAFRLGELEFYATNRPDEVVKPAEQALELDQDGPSRVVTRSRRSARLAPTALPLRTPSSLRLVRVDSTGQPTTIGELVDFSGPVDPFIHNFVRLAMASAEAEPPPPTEPSSDGVSRSADEAQTVEATLSTDAPAEVAVGGTADVQVRVELGASDDTLAHMRQAQIRLDEEIVALLAVDRREFEVVGDNRIRLAPPSPGQPSTGQFVIRSVKPGTYRVVVMFYQGSSDLGSIKLDVTVTAAPTSTERANASLTAMHRDESDDEVMIVLIHEERQPGGICYSYDVTWDTVLWNFVEFNSAPLKKRAGTSSTLRYVRTIYDRIVKDVLPRDIPLFKAQLAGIGADMCHQLFSDEFVRAIWPHRDKISAVQVTTKEPYIPWELLRLKHPDTGEVDEKFLCEYGLIRSLNGRSGPRELQAQQWRYLVASYPCFTLQPPGMEIDFLTKTLPASGHDVRAIPADAVKLLDALTTPDYDVLHITCHGLTDLKNVERSVLIITDEQTPSGPQWVSLNPTDVTGLGQTLVKRTPMVFLNACETGQQAPSLTDWGGWPRAFWEAGAGVFVGTSWSVHEQPAVVFAEAFYKALLDGVTLAEAATAGRSAAKESGDASWLAYVVYGNPVARVSTG